MRYWVDVALEAVRRDHTDSFGTGNQRGPFLTARALGLALAALHDAGVDDLPASSAQGRLLKLSAVSDPSNLDHALTRASACHHVLLLRYPAQADGLNAVWQTYKGLFPSTASPAAQAASERHGRRHGTELHLVGLDDSAIASGVEFAVGGDYWHGPPPDEPGQVPAGAKWGDASLLVASPIGGFPRPPGRTSSSTVVASPHYDLDFAKVRVKGRNSGGSRTPTEELIGIFWGYDGPQELGTPPRLYLQAALAVLDELQAGQPDLLTEEEELRLLAALALTMSDAGVEAWRYKYSPDHMMWRPARGVPAGLKGNASPGVSGWTPLGRPDTNGTALGRTPNFPAYPSGHATFGASAFQLLRVYLVHKGGGFKFDADGLDNVRFCCTSDEYNGRNLDPRPPRRPRPRTAIEYPSLWKAILDNSISRVYLGVHWQFDGVTISDANEPDGAFGVPAKPSQLGRRGGVWLGCQLGNQVAIKLMGVPQSVIDASRTSG